MHSRWTNFLTTDGEKNIGIVMVNFLIRSLKKELIEIWEKGWFLLFKAIKELQTKDLIKTITIRNNPLTVLEAIQIEIAHCSNHLGQILYIGKQIKGSDWEILSIPKGNLKLLNIFKVQVTLAKWCKNISYLFVISNRL